MVLTFELKVGPGDVAHLFELLHGISVVANFALQLLAVVHRHGVVAEGVHVVLLACSDILLLDGNLGL